MIKAYIQGIKNYANFQGRSGRADFWWFHLASCLLIGSITVIMWEVYLSLYAVKINDILSVSDKIKSFIQELHYIPLFILAGTVLFHILPSLALSVRRLHDTNKSGWWILLGLVPFGKIILIIFYAKKGSETENQYGIPTGKIQGHPHSNTAPPPKSIATFKEIRNRAVYTLSTEEQIEKLQKEIITLNKKVAQLESRLAPPTKITKATHITTSPAPTNTITDNPLFRQELGFTPSETTNTIAADRCRGNDLFERPLTHKIYQQKNKNIAQNPTVKPNPDNNTRNKNSTIPQKKLWIDAYLSAIENYFNFEGRLTRKNYWLFILFFYIFSALAIFVDNITGTNFPTSYFVSSPSVVAPLPYEETPETDINITYAIQEMNSGKLPFGFIFTLYTIAHIIPLLSGLSRRLHDTGKSASYIFLSFIPLIGSVILLIYTLQTGEKSKNKYDLT